MTSILAKSPKFVKYLNYSAIGGGCIGAISGGDFGATRSYDLVYDAYDKYTNPYNNKEKEGILTELIVRSLMVGPIIIGWAVCGSFFGAIMGTTLPISLVGVGCMWHKINKNKKD